MSRKDEAILQTSDLTVRYGGTVANDQVNVNVVRSEVTGLIGPNGAGKTTFVDAVSGFTRSSGTIMLDQTAIGRLPAHRRRAHGLARTWQAGELFNDLTVAENLMVAADPWNVRAAFHDIVRRSGKKSPAVDDALTLLGLDEVAHRKPTELSLGQQRLVGVGRALVGDTSVVLLDEPAAGLDTHESAAFGEDVRRVAASGIGVLLIDHDMSLVLKVCDYLYVMDFGHIIAEGPPDQVQRDERVIAAYLGVVDEEAVVQE